MLFHIQTYWDQLSRELGIPVLSFSVAKPMPAHKPNVASLDKPPLTSCQPAQLMAGEAGYMNCVCARWDHMIWPSRGGC